MRHAEKNDLRVFHDAHNAVARAKIEGASQKELDALARSAEDTTGELAKRCLVYPVALPGMSPNQHVMNIEASFAHFGYAGQTLGNEAARLGGSEAQAHRAKS